MKKLIFIFLMILSLLIMASMSWAGSTIVGTEVTKDTIGANDQFKQLHNLQVSYLITGATDDTTVSDTNLLGAAIISAGTADLMKRARIIAIHLHPGTGEATPGTTINIKFTDSKDSIIFNHDAYSYTANTDGIDASEDYPTFPPINKELNLTTNDWGATSDTIEIILDLYIE